MTTPELKTISAISEVWNAFLQLPMIHPDDQNEFRFHLVPDGTYELIGPKINGNKEGWGKYELIKHGQEKIYFPGGVTFGTVKRFLEELHYEGIVWHHPDGRMVKIKKKDFGFKW
jgi:hypothetical protein